MAAHSIWHFQHTYPIMSRTKQAVQDAAYDAFARKASEVMLAMRECGATQVMLLNNSDTLLEAHHGGMTDYTIELVAKRAGLSEMTSLPVAPGSKVYEWWVRDYIGEYLEVVFTQDRVKIFIK